MTTVNMPTLQRLADEITASWPWQSSNPRAAHQTGKPLKGYKVRKFFYLKVGIAVLTVMLLAACSADGDLDATSWELASYRNAEGDMADPLPESQVTLEFQDDQVSGMASCNSYAGAYQTTGSEIEFGTLAVTERMCIESEIMEQESAYLAALEAVAEYNLDRDRLEMKDDQGEPILVFVKAD